MILSRKELRIEDLTFLIDSREQRPLEFSYGPPDKIQYVKTEAATLTTGDYSIKGFEKLISIERKSLDDLLNCIGQDRERFEKELQRLLAYPCRLVAVEAHWDELELGHWRSRLTPKQVTGSIQGWMDMGIPFFFHHDRRKISNCIRNLMFIRARRTFELLNECLPHLKIA